MDESNAAKNTKYFEPVLNRYQLEEIVLFVKLAVSGPAGEEGEEPVYQKYGKGSVYKIYGYHYRIADITACPGNILVYVHSCKKGKFHDLGVVMDSHE